jgi:hypothetical protein
MDFRSGHDSHGESEAPMGMVPCSHCFPSRVISHPTGGGGGGGINKSDRRASHPSVGSTQSRANPDSPLRGPRRDPIGFDVGEGCLLASWMRPFGSSQCTVTLDWVPPRPFCRRFEFALQQGLERSNTFHSATDTLLREPITKLVSPPGALLAGLTQ